MGSGQMRAIGTDVCMVREAGRLFAYLAKESCAICVPCRVGTKRVQGILDGVASSLGRDSDLPWLTELGDHMEQFSLCGFGITAPSILRTTMKEFPDDYRAHISEGRCPTGNVHDAPRAPLRDDGPAVSDSCQACSGLHREGRRRHVAPPRALGAVRQRAAANADRRR